MKIFFKTLFLSAIAATCMVGCVADDDTQLPTYIAPLIAEKFNEGADNTLLVTPGWINFAETGTALWKIQVYNSNGYAEFSSFQSGNATNVAWLISPAIELAENNNKKLYFQSSQSYVSNVNNKLEVFISTNFDGTNVTAATWTPLEATLPGITAEYFEFMDSGIIPLSAFSGNARIAFKVTGSGTNQQLDGSYQIDNVNVYE